MQTKLYLVIHSRGSWWIDKEGKAYGPFSSQSEAIAAAPQFIELMGEDSQRNLLYAADESGKFAVIWSNAEVQQ